MTGNHRDSRPKPRWPLLLLLAALPALWLVSSRGAAFGHFSVDLAGHLWTGWAIGRDGVLHTRVIGWPEGVDLLPALGGWLDVAIVALLRPVLPLELAYDLVACSYLVVAGLGGWLLARELGASSSAALVAGLLLQLDGFVLRHLAGGRLEQVGLGFLAVFLALALRTWWGRCPRAAWQAGLAGALVLFVSWELSLLAGLALLLLLPFLVWGGQPPGLMRRLGVMVVAGAVPAVPWVSLFLVRAARVRTFDEGEFWLVTAHKAGIGLVGWLSPGAVRPGWLVLAALLALPWILPAEQRRLWLGIVLGLLLTLLLALGSHPGLLVPADPGGTPWGPFAWARGLPLLGWFHWPDRLLAAWSLAAAVAAALTVQWLGQRRRWAAVAVAALLMVDAGVETWLGGRWPTGSFRLPPHHGATQLASLPGAGAVLDLPPQPNAVNHLGYQQIQIVHGRPIRHHHHLSHLVAAGDEGSVDQQPLLSWFHALMQGAAPPRGPFTADELRGLGDAGFGFVVLHQKGWPPPRWARARAILLESLGEPVIQQGSQWICWRLPGAGEGES